MKFAFHEIDTLPRLAWRLQIRERSDVVDVWHGPWVETRDNLFCDGAWSDDFQNDQIESKSLVGSGARIVDGKLLLATPTHTMERIHLLRTDDGLLASNSLVFLLSQSGETLHPRSVRYCVLLASNILGLSSYPRYLPTASGRRVRLLYHANMTVDAQLRTTEQPKPRAANFASFADYRGFLASEVSRLVANAGDSRRRVAYRPLATISAGYDSPAAAVLARQCGCREAVTCEIARAGRHHRDSDSGAAIAERLGLSVETFDRSGYLSEPGFPEAEFYGSPTASISAVLARPFERRLVFSGHHGDTMWRRAYTAGADDLVRGDPSGDAQEEFRLRVGWQHLSVPFLGCTSYASINRISQSDEMNPWSVGGGYDRPIPRRIVETCGVDREMFGIEKQAIAIVPDREGGRERWMTPQSYQDFQEFCRESWTPGMSARTAAVRVLRWINGAHAEGNRQIQKRILQRLGVAGRLPNLIPRELRMSQFGPIDEMSLLFQWSAQKLADRYRF